MIRHINIYTIYPSTSFKSGLMIVPLVGMPSNLIHNIGVGEYNRGPVKPNLDANVPLWGGGSKPGP